MELKLIIFIVIAVAITAVIIYRNLPSKASRSEKDQATDKKD